MQEFDQHGTEFFIMYEKVRGGKHHKPLSGQEAALLRRIRHAESAKKLFSTAVTALIMILILASSVPEKQPVPDPIPNEIIPEPEPEPEPTPPPIPEPETETEIATETETESETETETETETQPETRPTPDPDPIPIPIPDPDPIPETETETETETESETETEFETETETESETEPTPTPEAAEPAFTEVSQTHSSPGIKDDIFYNDFYYTYKIALNDADQSQPITARLQLRDVKGGGWQEVSGNSQSFGGSGGTWNDTIYYDMAAVDMGSKDGLLREMRIVCSYMMADGSSGTIYSTYCGSLWSYMGSYLSPISAELKEETITAKFKVDMDLILNPDKLAPAEITLTSGASQLDLLGKAKISGPAADGTLTLTYKLDGVTIDTMAYNEVLLVLNYTDEGGDINWDSVAFVRLDARVAPTLELSLGNLGEPGSYQPGFGAFADLILNDLAGGHATITYQKLGPDGYSPLASFGTLEYSAGDEDENGRFSFGFTDPELWDLWGVDDHGIRYKAKYVIEYVYPDGMTGVLESEVFEQYGGGFAQYANDPAIRYDAENKILIAEVVLDLSLVEPENVSIIKTNAEYEAFTELPDPALQASGYASDGTYRMTFTWPLESITAGEYWCDIGLRYSNGIGPVWEQELFVTCNLE